MLTSPSGKSYVGKTVQTVRRRLGDHYRKARAGCDFPLSHAIRKYGVDEFDVEILFVSDDEDHLLELEERMILELGTLCPTGYNARLGGPHGRQSDESRAKIAAARRGKPRSDEDRRRISEGMRRYAATDQGRENLAKARALRHSETQ